MGIVFFVVYLLSLILFGLGLLFHGNQYYEAIDPVDTCYIPFGGKHIATLIFYFIAFNVSAFLIWTKGRSLPPLTLVLSLIFLFIGAIINVAILLQVMGHNTESVDMYKGDDGTFFFIFSPPICLLISIMLIEKIINEEKIVAKERIYKTPFLNDINNFLARKFDESVWAIIFLFPVFLLVTLILILVGQDANSIVKTFTDTTTWTFSQKMHPPILDHKGHYLCTVAAKGNPKIVKPICLGKRHGNIIIVNRQLQIANAFEEMITDFSPTIHHFIRKNYDKYGYNISTKINSRTGSNITYMLMKPLEWFFLICLYLTCINPEKKINKQYV